MLRVILGIFAVVTCLQTRARYRVLDPFSSNGLWTEVSSNLEDEGQKSLPHSRNDGGNSDAMSTMERGRQMQVAKPRPAQLVQSKLDKSQEEGRKRDEREVAEVVHHYKTDSSLPYLPDLTALKQITGAGPAPVTLAAADALKHAQLKQQARRQDAGESNKQTNSQNQIQLRSTKRRPRRKSPHSESWQPNVAPPMPQLPSLAAATDAPLPPEYPRWDSSLLKSSQRPPTTEANLLEMDSNSGAHLRVGVPESSLSRFRYLSDSPDAFASASIRLPLSESRSAARASWPSDVSPPSDYFLPPEVLI